DLPDSPTEWYRRAERWNDNLKKVEHARNEMSPAVLLEAWFRFNSTSSDAELPNDDTSLEDRLTATMPANVAQKLASLAAGIYGLPDEERRAILFAAKLGHSPRTVKEIEDL